MTKQEAIARRDEYRQKLVGHKFDNLNGWIVRDVIASARGEAGNTYTSMYTKQKSNDEVLAAEPATVDQYQVYVITHQWPSGIGDLVYQELDSYRANNHIE